MTSRSDRSRSALVLAALLCSALLGAFVPDGARGQEHAFAGSAQASYLYVPTTPSARTIGFDGFVPELALKATADVNDHVSAQAKVCFGCHGFELAMTFVDLRVADELNFRVGRFNPSFGEFALRQDPANHSTISKPLAYDMGRMLRLREWNMGVLPIPYVDTGLEVSGTHWFGDAVQLDYAAYVVGGLRGSRDGVDLDFVQSRSPAFYYVDNNSQPAFGARVALTATPSDRSTITLGGSGMYGHYDPDRRLSYAIVGADLYARFDWFTLRAEWLVRRTEMFLGENPEERFRYGPGSDGRYSNFFLKQGYYVEAEVELLGRVRLVARFDGLRRVGNVLANDPLRATSAIRRYTVGLNVLPHPAYRIKLFSELYDFSDFQNEITVQAAVAAAF